VTTTTTHPSSGAGDDAPAPSGQASGRSPRNSRQTSRLLTRLHFFAGIICAPLILVAAVTGLFYAVAPTVEQVNNHDMLTAPEQHGVAVPVSEQVATAQETYPDLALAGIRLGDADETTRVLFNDPGLPESTLRVVFVDPYTGEITGDTTQYGSSAALPFRQWISDGHRNLWLGEPGRLYSETAASWLGVLAVGGVVILWRRQRKSDNRVAGMFRRDGAGRTRMMRRHGATGTVIAVGLVFLTVTGLTWSSVAGANITELRQNLSWTEPAVSTTLTGAARSDNSDHAAHAAHAGHGGHAGHSMTSATDTDTGTDPDAVDRVAATARRDLRTPVTLTPPTAEGEAWQAAENRASWRFTTDAVAVDGATGRVTDRLDSTDWPLAAQVSAWLIQLHMGTLLGLPNQIILALLAAAVIVMVVRGYAMWWMRRPANGLAAPPRRAAWGRPTPGTLLLGAALVVYGSIAPLFGMTCLVFLALSTVWDTARRVFRRR
jgi:uncharacterized iron-regulated membrane protein